MTTQPDRIPIAHSIVYAVRGMPEIADEYNATRTIAPTEISLTYQAAEDEQLGRVHAYVSGWWMQDGARIPTDKPVGRHFWGHSFGEWPEWLAGEAMLHDPEPAVVAPATDRATLRDRIANALLTTRRTDYEGTANHREHRYDARCALCAYDVDALAGAVLSELPASVDQAAVLDDEAALIVRHCPDHGPQDQDGVWMDCHCAVAEDMRKRANELRRAVESVPVAVEAQQPKETRP